MRPVMTMAVLAVAASLAAGSVSAETLNLICRVHWSKPGGARRDGLRRLDIDLGARTVRVSDDLGRGWKVLGQHGILSADKDRIRLDDADGKVSYVDRLTGQYAFHNQKDGVTIKGPCDKAAALRPRF